MSDYIPEEVLVDILTKLPVETIIRCTLVCKSWYSLITSTSFISQHLQRTITDGDNGHLLVRYCTENPRQEHYSLRCDGTSTFDEYAKLNFPFTCLNPNFGVIGSCNGLICCSDDQFSYNHTMFVWNPSIRKAMLIPDPNFTFTSHGTFMQSLGFGFDSVTNDFKVVRIAHFGLDCDRVPPEVEVYTLKTECWRSISDKALPYIVKERCQQAYVNGTAHWLAFTPRKVATFRNLIVSFNMNDEVFSEMLLPDSVACEDNIWLSLTMSMRLVVFEESLVLIQHFRVRDDRYCSIWMMKEYGVAASWSYQFRIDLCGGLRNPLGLRKNGEVLLSSTGGYRTGGFLVSYDPEGRRSMNLGICGTVNPWDWHSFYVDTYVESLFLLDKGATFCDMVVSDLI